MKENFIKLVNYFGGQPKTCEALNVAQSTVSGWVTGKHGCEAEIAFLAEIKTNGFIKAEDLRPSLAKFKNP